MTQAAATEEAEEIATAEAGGKAALVSPLIISSTFPLGSIRARMRFSGVFIVIDLFDVYEMIAYDVA